MSLELLGAIQTWDPAWGPQPKPGAAPPAPSGLDSSGLPDFSPFGSPDSPPPGTPAEPSVADALKKPGAAPPAPSGLDSSGLPDFSPFGSPDSPPPGTPAEPSVADALKKVLPKLPSVPTWLKVGLVGLGLGTLGIVGLKIFR